MNISLTKVIAVSAITVVLGTATIVGADGGTILYPQAQGQAQMQTSPTAGCTTNSEFGRKYNICFTWDAQLRAQLNRVVARLQEQLAEQDGEDTNNDAEVTVTTGAASDIDEDSVSLTGRVTLEDSDEAEVWFQFGTSRSSLSNATSRATVDENGSFDATLSGLSDDTTYYYRAVAEDEDGERDSGVIRSFTTDNEGSTNDDDDDDDNNDEDEPEVTTDSAEDIGDDTADLMGSVNMNDFDNGRVFFVWGQDENMVSDAEDADTFEDIDEDGDDLMKQSVETGFDDDEDFMLRADDLEADTEYFFAIGVEYEDEDGDEQIILGDVESFTTEE